MKHSKEPIAVTDAWLAAQAHPTKNSDPTRTVHTLTAGSDKNLCWVCPVGPHHDYEMRVGHRKRGRGCPYCAGKRTAFEDSLAVTDPWLAAQAHPTKNTDPTRTVHTLTAGSGKTLCWICPVGPHHDYEMPVSARKRGSGCPYCAGKRTAFEDSLAVTDPWLAEQAHPEKNTDPTRTVHTLTAGSGKTLCWICPVGPHHDYDMAVTVRKRGSGCPYCAGKRTAFENSLEFLHPALARQWFQLRNGELTPAQVLPGSDTWVWWKCSEAPDHIWRQRVEVRTRREGRGCPACAGYQTSDTNSIRIHYAHLVPEWHPTLNEKSIDDFVYGSNESAHWICKECQHVWRAGIVTRTTGGHGCKLCGWDKAFENKRPVRSRPEVGLAFELFHFLNMGSRSTIEDLEGQVYETFLLGNEYLEDRKLKLNGRSREADIIIREYNLVIEYDGWHHRDRYEKDKKKTEELWNAGWSVIRVREEPLPLITDLDISVPRDNTKKKMKCMVDDVLCRIQEISKVKLDGLDEYLAQPDLLTAAASESYYKRLPGRIKMKRRSRNVGDSGLLAHTSITD